MVEGLPVRSSADQSTSEELKEAKGMKGMRFVVALAAVVLTGSAFGAMYDYGDFVSSDPDQVNFMNVEGTAGPNGDSLYGPATRTRNVLRFTPQIFRAEAKAENGETVSLSGTLTMQIDAPAQRYIESIRILEAGTYMLSGVAGVGTSANVVSSLNLSAGLYDLDVDLDITPMPPFTNVTGVQTGWSGTTGLIDLTGANLTSVVLTFTNTLTATNVNGTTASIEKTYVGEATSLEVIVPEPVTLVMLAIGAVGLLGRRR